MAQQYRPVPNIVENEKTLLYEIMPCKWYGEEYLTTRKSNIEFDFNFGDEDDMFRIYQKYLTYLWRK